MCAYTHTHTRVTRRHARTDTWDSTRSDFWVGVHRARLLVNIPANISPFSSFSFFFFFSPPPLSLPLLFRPSTSRFSPSVRSFFFLFSRRHVRETAPRAEPISRRRSSSEFWNAFERKNLERARARGENFCQTAFGHFCEKSPAIVSRRIASSRADLTIRRIFRVFFFSFFIVLVASGYGER